MMVTDTNKSCKNYYYIIISYLVAVLAVCLEWDIASKLILRHVWNSFITYELDMTTVKTDHLFSEFPYFVEIKSSTVECIAF